MFIASCISALLVDYLPALANTDPFQEILAEFAANPDMVEAGWSYRDPAVTRGVGHGTPSLRKISKNTYDLIIACEVSSPAVYDRRYRQPVWPKGQSGVTVGVGYDLSSANRSYIERDWPMLSRADRELLAKVAGLAGNQAEAALSMVRSVQIPWDAARAQFFAFLPYPAKQTEDAFPNCDELSDDSFGALVSLVYNRGPKISRNSKSRREMYVIQQLMAEKQFVQVPAQLRSMRRLWTTRESRGVALRREAEAVLFEDGLGRA